MEVIWLTGSLFNIRYFIYKKDLLVINMFMSFSSIRARCIMLKFILFTFGIRLIGISIFYFGILCCFSAILASAVMVSPYEMSG